MTPFTIDVSSRDTGFIGSGSSLDGESLPDAFVRLFAGMLGLDGPGEWAPASEPGEFTVTGVFSADSIRGPAASNIFQVMTSPPQALPV